MFKFLNFSVTQILREFIFGESRSSKTASFAILGALKFVDLVNFSLQKVQKFIKIKYSEPFNLLKWQILRLDSPILISCKIWVTVQFCNFYIYCIPFHEFLAFFSKKKKDFSYSKLVYTLSLNLVLYHSKLATLFLTTSFCSLSTHNVRKAAGHSDLVFINFALKPEYKVPEPFVFWTIFVSY